MNVLLRVLMLTSNRKTCETNRDRVDQEIYQGDGNCQSVVIVLMLTARVSSLYFIEQISYLDEVCSTPGKMRQFYDYEYSEHLIE